MKDRIRKAISLLDRKPRYILLGNEEYMQLRAETDQGECIIKADGTEWFHGVRVLCVVMQSFCEVV